MTIVAISGGFDCLHVGHLDMIEAAYKIGNVIVILNSDEWLKRKKGYVFMPYKQRERLILALRKVWDVQKVDDADGTVREALNRIKPDYFANGGDRTEQNTPEKKLCDKLGIKMLWGMGGGKVESSSELVKNATR
jgi:cytidyltransferase-like protein